jgi:hypothetical protein
MPPPPSDSDGATPLAAGSSSAAAEPAAPAALAEAAAESVVQPGSQPAAAAETPSGAVPDAAPTAPSLAAEAVSTTAMPGEILRLSARETTWVEVLGAGGRVVVQRNLQAGESVGLSAAVPLTVGCGGLGQPQGHRGRRCAGARAVDDQHRHRRCHRHRHPGQGTGPGRLELVRITVNTPEAAEAVPHIREQLDRMGINVPLIGDFHYNGHRLLTDTRRWRRRCPSTASTPATSARATSATASSRRWSRPPMRTTSPVRIGVNWGSLDQELLAR